MPVGAPQGALPFRGMSEEAIYLAKRFTGATLLERYVEWVGAGAIADGGADGGSPGSTAAATPQACGGGKAGGSGKKKKKGGRRR